MATVHEHEQSMSMGGVATPLSESVAAIAVIVLTILGLLNVVPTAMIAIATIVVGGAILLEGAEMVGEYSRLQTGAGAVAVTESLGSGVTLEFLAGGVGIVLGILALFSHTPVLAPAALIVFGGTLLLHGGAVARRPSGASLAATANADPRLAAMATQMAGATSGGHVLIGVAAIVLGILALVPIHDMILTLVGLLAVGTALLMSSLGKGGLMMNVLQR